MELRPGYKQSEVGVIPEDWEVSTIQDLLDQMAIVGHLDGNHGELYPRSHEFKDSGVPYVTANDLCGHRVSFNNCKYLSEERARRFRKGVAKSGDVLFAHNATVGPTALLSTELDYVVLSTTATYFRCNPGKLLNSFLLYALQSASFVDQYRAVMAQSTRNQVPITAQRKLSLVLPASKAEQHAIAKALGDADALVESLEQLLTKKRQLKKGAMQELLTGKKRLPGFSGDWKLTRLGNVLTFQVGFPFSSLFFNEEGIGSRLVKNRDLKSDDQVFHYSGKFDLGFLVQDGDVLVGMDGDFLPCLWAKGAALLNQRVGRIVSLSGLNRVFAYYYLVEPLKEIESTTSSTTVKHLSHGDVEGIERPLPRIEEQIAIATILSDMDADISALEAKLTKARVIKQGMMQELLTGNIRLIKRKPLSAEPGV